MLAALLPMPRDSIGIHASMAAVAAVHTQALMRDIAAVQIDSYNSSRALRRTPVSTNVDTQQVMTIASV